MNIDDTVEMPAITEQMLIQERATRDIRRGVQAESIDDALKMSCRIPSNGSTLVSPDGKRCWIAGRARNNSKLVLVFQAPHTVREVYPEDLSGYRMENGRTL